MVKGRIVHSGDGSLVQKINEEGFDQFIPQEIKDAERREKLAAAAKNAMDAVKANAARELEGLSMDEVKKSINGGSN
jgi:hypothetical protein